MQLILTRGTCLYTSASTAPALERLPSRVWTSGRSRTNSPRKRVVCGSCMIVGPPHTFFLVKFWVSSPTANKRAHKSRGLPAQATGSKGDSLRTCPGQPEPYQFSWLPVSAPLAARNRKEFCPQGGMDGTSAGVGTYILRRLH